MTDLRCKKCGHSESWESIKGSNKPAEHDNHKERAERGEAHTAKVVCPECGNDSFDRMDEPTGQDSDGETDIDPEHGEKTHDCVAQSTFKEIEAVDCETVQVLRVCEKCGREFVGVYDYYGAFDPEKEEWIDKVEQ